MTTLAEFDAYIAQLNQHDWSHEYSDDHRVWSRGMDSLRKLEAGAMSNEYFKKALDAYATWYQRGGAIEKILRDAVIADMRHAIKVAATVDLIPPREAA